MNHYTLDEIKEIMSNLGIEKFWGEMVIHWQDGKIPSFKITATHKKTEGDNPRQKRGSDALGWRM